jgi:two-component system NtrC family sensor kinase
VIKFSTKESEIGQTVDMKAEACYICHTANQPIVSLPIQKKRRIYHTTNGQRIMGLINPIRNEPGCSDGDCHAHEPDQTILGVLDVKMSLAELDLEVTRSRIRIYILLSGLIFFALILFALVIYLLIHRPFQYLQTGMVRLSVGELDYRIEMKRKDELGLLAQSFNNMAENLKGAYNRMLQVEKMASLGKMAATVAHELNNPLSGIVTNAKLIQKKVMRGLGREKDREKGEMELDLILSESMRCGNIVRNLLEFAHGSSAKFQDSKLQDIVDRALGIVGHHIKLAKIKVDSQIRISPETICCDPDQLLQAFVAMLVNSVEAMKTGGELVIEASNATHDPNYIIINVCDNGPGIPSDVQDKIFEPFFSTKREKTGVGLGLAVVYGIVQRHQGRIWFESHKEEGTKFFIELPIKHQDKNKND